MTLGPDLREAVTSLGRSRVRARPLECYEPATLKAWLLGYIF
jgi:hypothetical protein